MEAFEFEIFTLLIQLVLAGMSFHKGNILAGLGWLATVAYHGAYIKASGIWMLAV